VNICHPQHHIPFLLVMAGGQAYKFKDRRFIWFNSLIGEPQGVNHQAENSVRAKYPKAGKCH